MVKTQINNYFLRNINLFILAINLGLSITLIYWLILEKSGFCGMC
jgi:hypothetical protein